MNLIYFLAVLFFAAAPVSAAPADSVIKGSGNTLYYHTSQGFRYVFPNQKIYNSWFSDFSNVETISDSEMQNIPLRGVVPYRPGIRLVKITSDPRTYAVAENAVLRWIKSEGVASALYGNSWNQNVDDLPDSFFTNYSTGAPIENSDDFVPAQIAATTRTVNRVLGVQEGSSALTSDTEPGIRSAGKLLPDLVPFAPYDIKYSQENGRTLLRFTSTFWNSGQADLHLLARDKNNTFSPGHDDTYDTYQRIPIDDGTTMDSFVGELFWHDSHDHYHYNEFGNYSLSPARVSPGTKSGPTLTNKTTFCQRDDTPVDLSLPNARQQPYYLGCGNAEQGVSVGWADVYPSTLPDQYIDVTDLAPGTYSLSFEIDPYGHFVEGDTSNNKSSTIVELNPAQGILNIIASGSAYHSSQNSFPHGTLVRGESDAWFYAIANNTKRVLRSDAVITSYGYFKQSAYVLPDGVISAIPNTSFIRFEGSVYMLNSSGYIRRILNPEVLASYAESSAIADINAEEFNSYTLTDLILRPSTDQVYSVSERRRVGSVNDAGLNQDSVHRINETDFASYAVEVISTGHVIPWDVAFLPGGDMILTERTGLFRRSGSENIAVRLDEVLHTGEGGLMGIAVHPDFSSNHFIYLYYTTQDNSSHNRIERFKLEGSQLIKDRIILDNIPASLYHDGGQIAFGPDGMLYVTTGDASQPSLSQDLNSLAGKTLRLTPDGDIPSDNPFGTAVWSYGHRNAQGLAWDDRGRLWETEHGRSGAASGYDELNLIDKAANYGWPNIQGDEGAVGMERPVIHSGPTTTWAPSGMAYKGGSIFFAGLRGETLYEAIITADGSVSGFREHLKGDYGRLRAVTVGPDGHLYVSTSNRDGRASVREGDDKVLRVHPDFL